MIDHAVTAAAGTLGNWAARREAKGKPPSDDDMRREAMARWPDMTREQIDAAIALRKKRKEHR